MTTLDLYGPMQVPPGGDLRLVARVETSESFQLALRLPEGAVLIEGEADQLISVEGGSSRAEFSYRVQLAGPLQAPIRVRLTAASGEVQEESYPPATLVMPTPGGRALTIASLLIGAAGVGVGVLALLQGRGTRKRLRARDADSDERLRSNYDSWRAEERAAAKARRAARRARRSGAQGGP